MLDVLKQTTAAMTAPDQMFAITETEVRGNMMKTWANAPGSLRELWLSTDLHSATAIPKAENSIANPIQLSR